ncbi:MAG: metallophosphoesterase [Deltaproteobacteria bacterium]|nr:metallophosphoesterase [Deltaproteobacteria bacterium]
MAGPAFALFTFASSLGLVLNAASKGGRFPAVFLSVVLGLHGASAALLYPALGALGLAMFPLQAAVILHFWRLANPSDPSRAWRWLVSLPASAFWAATFLGLPWAFASALGFTPAGVWIPFVGAAFGLAGTLRLKPEERDLPLDGAVIDGLHRVKPPPTPAGGRPLRLVQITDPHLGTFMPVERLKAVCERAVAQDPDLILLTGDFLTFETNGTRGALAEALSPLKAMPGRVFACRGNHDLEAPEEVARSLAAVGARLLIDEAVVVDTPAGKVQLVGADFRFRDRAQHLGALASKYPRVPETLRLWLLHDPMAFTSVPEGEADLTLSGHTHGGQVGLVAFGLDWTVVSGLFGLPDHGLWARGRDRMMIHRGTGHYGFPLRLGVPAEESLLRVWWTAEPKPA